MQEVTNLQDSDIQVPYWLSIYHSSYGRAAMALNWRVLWLGEGAITGIVAEVSAFLQDFGFDKYMHHVCGSQPVSSSMPSPTKGRSPALLKI